MQAEKDKRIGKCSKNIENKLASLLSNCLGIDPKSSSHEPICRITGTAKIDIYIVAEKAAKEAEALIISGIEPFTVGIHAARLHKGRLTPFLGLASYLRLQNKIPPPKGYIIVNEKAEKLFLYGRDILPKNVVKAKEPGCKEGIVLVLNKYRDPLGWGRIRKHQNTIYIQNIIDAGWYLRSGV